MSVTQSVPKEIYAIKYKVYNIIMWLANKMCKAFEGIQMNLCLFNTESLECT